MAKLLQRILFGFLLPILVCSNPSSAQEPGQELLLLEVRLDEAVISSAIPAFDSGPHTLMPLGELARLLSLAIQTQPDSGTASGFVLTEERSFGLNTDTAQVTRAGSTEDFDPVQVLVEPDDLYVSLTLLEAWLPIELDIDRSRLILNIHPLELLPVQTQLQRIAIGERIGRITGEVPDYPHADLPYRLWSPPVIDQSLIFEYGSNDEAAQLNTRYAAHLAGDLLGLESSIYFNKAAREPSEDLRVTLGRQDPDAGLLGFLHARTIQGGSLSSISMENITGGVTGRGLTLSNRPLTQSTRFDRQTFQGDLTPGWDVELFYNDALIGFQQPNAEGRYLFEDLPLGYGRNDFQLVFHGPLGQNRVEQFSYALADSMVQPGQFQYNLLQHRDEHGFTRSIAQFDLGISRALSTMGSFIRAPVAGVEHQYTSIALRSFWRTLSLSTDFTKDHAGGSLTELGVKTSVARLAVDATRIYAKNFSSDLFQDGGDPITTRDTFRLNGSIPLLPRVALPLTVEARIDNRESGRIDKDLKTSISAYAFNTAVTNMLTWRSFNNDEDILGALRISRRLRDMSIRGQVNYELGANTGVSVVALTADRFLGEGYRLTMGIAHELVTPETRYSAGFTKSLGRYGLGVNASYADTGEVSVGVQFVLALGRDSARSGWLLDARPMASTGAASVRAFLDGNDNGAMDPGEDPLPGVGFTVNGGRHQARTDVGGVTHIDHFPVKQRVNIGVDTSTLEDPQWAPAVAGRSLVARPGRIAVMEFPIRMTTEIDGTIYLSADGQTRAMGGVELELVDKNNTVVATTTSSWDGFYIVPGVVAGAYSLRISAAQLQRLGLDDPGSKAVTVDGSGEFINGMDMTLTATNTLSGV